MYEDNDVNLLVKLGLTSLQAKVYLTLIRLGKAKARTISAAAKIDRADVYRVIGALQNQSLVEKIIAIPLEFRAIPVQDGIKILLEQKDKENTEICRKAMALLQKFKNVQTQPACFGDKERMIVVPPREQVVRKLSELVLTAQKTVYAVNDWDGAMEGSDVVAMLYRKKRKHVRLKSLITGPKGKKPVSKGAKYLTEKGMRDCRWYPKPISVKLIMRDKEEMVLSIQSSPSTTMNQYLWTKNLALVEIIRDYFELMWKNSKELKIQEEKAKVSHAGKTVEQKP